MKEIRTLFRDFPNGPAVENPPANVEDLSWIPGLLSIPHAAGQLSPCITLTDPMCSRACALQQEKPPQ